MILPIIGVAVGLFVVVAGILEIRGGKSSKDWPTVEGRIAAAKITSEYDSRPSGMARRIYVPKIEYVYSVDGREYRSKLRSFAQYQGGTPELAKEIADKYPEGKSVTVHYNPKRPKIAVLETGVRWGGYAIVGLGVFFLAVGVIAWFVLQL